MKKVSLRTKLWRMFIIISIVPVLILGVFSYYNISRTLHENTEMMARNNLLQADNNLNVQLGSFKELLYQIYTDDDMVMWADRLNSGTDEAVTVNQMRRFLNALLNSREYIRAITIMTADGSVITCEHMTPATYKSSWLSQFSLSPEELYQDVIRDYDIHIYPTEYGTNFDNRDYYLFHMAHRIVDYRNLTKECGVAVISIDEELLQDVCLNSVNDERVFNFITDGNGRIISFGEETSFIGTKVTDPSLDETERLSDYTAFLKGQDRHFVKDFEIYLYHDAGLSWDIVNVTDLSSLLYSQRRQLVLIVILWLMIMFVAVALSTGLAKNLVSSVKRIVKGMEEAQGGDLSVRIEKDTEMPLEIESIADGFNDMLTKLHEAIERQREAQIVALEAQINPHFLYNTLDTINWMAIDKDEYDISNAINALATILRYAIDASNAEVRVSDEVEWLKKYIYLQQYRLKNQFSCSVYVEPEAASALIHKLLLQPFVENSIVHGFDKSTKDAELSVDIRRQGDELAITIEDNGIGMSEETVKQVNEGFPEDASEGAGIGMKNAVTRLRMYYGNAGRVQARSDTGTRIIITIPYCADLRSKSSA
ncbi:MAG: sensor histidine kinase [Lachnospiraceae bacterium]|nr:sensor histidine kinase [Lachnospiraceae bacterium]